MSQNNPFMFSAGGGQPSAPPAAQPDQNNTQHSQMQPPPDDTATQQTAFQQNAALPALDMSALAGVSMEQLTAIMRLFQAGALQLPPQVAAALPQPQLPQNGTAATPPAAAKPVPPTSTLIDQSKSAPDEDADVDMDKEEGEVGEDEDTSSTKVRDFLRPPPTGPRSRSVTPRGPRSASGNTKSSPKVSKRQQPDKRKKSQSLASEPVQQKGQTSVGKDAASKLFILEMVKAGYTFEQLASQVENRKPLIRMFKQLDLPTTLTTVAAQPADASTTSPSATAATSAEEAHKTAAAKRPVSAKTGPVDRNEYLARLQAAKSKKAETTSVAAPTERADERPATPPAASRQIPTIQSDAQPSSSNLSSPATKSVDKTELARQKLEALRAQQAAKKNGTLLSKSASSPAAKHTTSLITNGQPASSPLRNSLGAGLADIASQVGQPSISQASQMQPPTQPPVPVAAQPQLPLSPTPTTPNRSFSGLPGLFMTTASASPAQQAQLQQINTSLQSSQVALSSGIPQSQTTATPASLQNFKPTPTASPAPLQVPRKRPVAADFDDPQAKFSNAKRPFGGSKVASEDESLIIEVSDDEDEDDDIKIEEPAQLSLKTKPFRDAAPLRDFPPKPNLSAQSSTPGTAGGVTYEQRMKEIDDMKRKILEAEKRKKINGIAGEAQAQVLYPLPAVPPMRADAIMQYPDGQVLPGSVHTPKPAVAQTKAEEKEMLRKRLLELQQAASGTSSRALEAIPKVSTPVPTVSGALPNDLSDAEPMETVKLSQISSAQNTTADTLKLGEFSDGELSDDSVSKLYGPADDHDKDEQMQLGGRESDVSRVEATVTSRSQPSPAYDQHAELAETDIKQIQPTLPVDEAHLRNAEMEGITGNDAPDLADATREDGELVTDDSDESMDSSHDSHDEHSDIPEGQAAVQSRNAGVANSAGRSQHGSRGGDGGPTNSDSSSASSTDADGYEPEYAPDFESASLSGGVNATSDSSPAAAEIGATISRPGVEGDVTDGDLAPELQPTDEELAESTDQAPAKSRHYFTPYTSPLTAFKDYVYHPDYLNTVPEGFKSMTYNHNIDPVNQICQFEATGGKCNDQGCQYQHFKSMTLNDNDLLRRMGTKNIPAHDAEEQKRWNEGLGAVIKQLRTTSLGRDASAIAAKIAEFRRDFVGDPTKILNLG